MLTMLVANSESPSARLTPKAFPTIRITALYTTAAMYFPMRMKGGRNKSTKK